MKKFLLATVMFLTIAFAGYTQPGKIRDTAKRDTICLPVSDVIYKQKQADSLTVTKKEIANLKLTAITFEKREINLKYRLLQSRIKYNAQADITKSVERQRDEQEAKFKKADKRIGELEVDNASLKRRLKWANTKTWLTGGAGVVLTAAVYLFITK